MRRGGTPSEPNLTGMDVGYLAHGSQLCVKHPEVAFAIEHNQSHVFPPPRGGATLVKSQSLPTLQVATLRRSHQ